MFTAKQKQLFETKTTQTTSGNAFINAAQQKAAVTTSGNGAKKYETTNNIHLDDFGSYGSYKQPRQFIDIERTVSSQWAKNPRLTLCLIFFIRTITRIVSLFDGTKTKSVQKGGGLRYESIMRFLWVGIYHKDSFYKNLHLFVSVGSWKDVFQMLSYDLQYHGWKDRRLDWDFLGKFILAGLENSNTTNLVKKYLPQIKSNSQCKTLEAQADNLIAKWICQLLFGNKENETGSTYKKYRKLKTSGTAHEWQKLISQGKFLQINFNSVAGRALSQLVSSKFLSNNNLEQVYNKWIESKPVAKYTGFVHELAAEINSSLKPYQINTINAQFNQLLQLGGKTSSNLIAIKDCSTSMNNIAYGTKMSSYNVAKAMCIYLSKLLKGHFNNHYIDFSSKAILRTIEGSNFVEHWKNERRVASADTNFLAVADLLISVKNTGVSEKAFPTGVLCLSDGNFNQTGMYNTTNVEAFKAKLRPYFSKDFIDNFQFVFWDIWNSFYGSKSKTKFETFGPAKNVFYFSGFSPEVITFLTGQESKEIKSVPKNAEEVFNAAMDQEALNMIEI